MAVTLGWTTVGISGVPVGAQTLTLSCSTTGWPPAVTRTAATVYWAVTQGPLPAVGTKVQPATVHGLAMVTTGWPDTVTRGKGVVGKACPAWEHMTVAPRCMMGPGISPSRYTTFSAPLLMFTAGPTMTMLAPLPFWM